MPQFPQLFQNPQIPDPVDHYPHYSTGSNLSKAKFNPPPTQHAVQLNMQFNSLILTTFAALVIRVAGPSIPPSSNPPSYPSSFHPPTLPLYLLSPPFQPLFPSSPTSSPRSHSPEYTHYSLMRSNPPPPPNVYLSPPNSSLPSEDTKAPQMGYRTHSVQLTTVSPTYFLEQK